MTAQSTNRSLQIGRFIPASFQRLTPTPTPKPAAVAHKPSRDFLAELKELGAKIFKSAKDDKVFFVKDGGLIVDVEKAFADRTGKIYGWRKPGVDLRPLVYHINFLLDGARREQRGFYAPIVCKFEAKTFPTEATAAQNAEAEAEAQENERIRKFELEQAAVEAKAARIASLNAAAETKKAARIAKAALAEAKRLEKDFGACKVVPKAAKQPKAEAGKKKGKK